MDLLYKTEIKIIYFVTLCLIVSACILYPDPKFLIFKNIKKQYSKTQSKN